MAAMGGGGGGGGYQQPTYQSSNPYGSNYRPPSGPQGTPAGPITPPKPGAAPVETEEERRRRQALILGSGLEGVGDGGDGSGGAASAGGDSGGDGTGGGTGGTY